MWAEFSRVPSRPISRFCNPTKFEFVVNLSTAKALGITFPSGLLAKLLNTSTADRRNVAKLGTMGPDCIDHRGLLSNKQVPRAMEHQTALLFRCLGWHEPHVDPADRLAYRLGVSGIVLLSF
jgi:hypothetical protein